MHRKNERAIWAVAVSVLASLWLRPAPERSPAIAIAPSAQPEQETEATPAPIVMPERVSIDESSRSGSAAALPHAAEAVATTNDCAAAIGRLQELLPNEQPYAAWLATPQAAGATEAERADVRATLTDFPVHITEREGAWLLARIRANDWHLYGSGRSEATIIHLGPQRLLEEAPPEWIERERTWHTEEEWRVLFGGK